MKGDAVFDPVVHADLSFTEKLLTHFLELLASPRSPFAHHSLERTAATFTTVPIINNLFLFSNVIVDIIWFELLVQITGKTKWDGVAIALKHSNIAPMIIKMSGGIIANSTPKKEKDDESKLVENLVAMLKHNEAMGFAHLIPQYYIRFFNNAIYFEALFLKNDGTLVNRLYSTVNCPTNC